MAHWHYSPLFCTLYLRNGVISLLSFLAILELFWHSSKTLLRHSSQIVPHPTPSDIRICLLFKRVFYIN